MIIYDQYLFRSIQMIRSWFESQWQCWPTAGSAPSAPLVVKLQGPQVAKVQGSQGPQRPQAPADWHWGSASGNQLEPRAVSCDDWFFFLKMAVFQCSVLLLLLLHFLCQWFVDPQSLTVRSRRDVIVASRAFLHSCQSVLGLPVGGLWLPRL